MIRSYKSSDYDQLKELYLHPEWFGGQLDETRDSRDRLTNIIHRDPQAILVNEEGGKLNGSVSLIEDGRVAWLFRFVVEDNNQKIAQDLYKEAADILRDRGHSQILVYTPKDDDLLASRYQELGMTKGSEYTSYWAAI